MKRWFPAAILLIAALAVFTWWLGPKETDKPPPALPAGVSRPVPPPAPDVGTENARVTLPIAATAAALNDPAGSAQQDLQTLHGLLGEYRRHLGGNPVGDNAEITAALSGANPKRLACLPANGPFLDASGHLIDRWGTPYFFHALSGEHMEIHSAGPDHEFHSADDLRGED